MKISKAAKLLGIAAVAASSACGRHGGVTNPGPVRLALRTVATGMSFPLFLTAPPGDFRRLFVVEKGGFIRIIEDGALRSRPFLDLSGSVSRGVEQGLLGLAFDPGYSRNGRFYVSYTDLAGTSQIVRYRVSANPDAGDPASAEPILSVDQPDPLHNGGMIVFGPDGYLYVGLGDGDGETADALNNGQDLTDLLGSILRIDVSGAAGYTIPAGNPFTTPPARPELWNYGLRNPWRFSFDRATGDLYIGDVGRASREEIDVAPTAQGRGKGANYGWKILEGTRCTDAGHCDTTGLTTPVLEYEHGTWNPVSCCVIGGYVYRGSAIPALRGTYFYGDLCGWVRSFVFSGGQATSRTDWHFLDPRESVTSFGEDARGELYVLTMSGSVFRIVSG